MTVVARLDGNGRLARLTISDPADPARAGIRLPQAVVQAGSDPAARDRLDRAARNLYCLLDGQRLHVVNEAAPDLQDEALEQAVATFVARGAVPARSEPAHRRRHAA